MRIITGSLKGRKLKTKKVMDFRPSTGKFKEAVFSILNAQKFTEEKKDNFFEGKIVYDLFAGSGIYAFESISRGANKAYALDIERENVNLIKENALLLKLENQISALVNDIRFLSTTRLPQADIIFMDPPYNEDLISPVLKILKPFLKDTGIIVIECAFNQGFEYEGYNLAVEKVYGRNNKLSILTI